MSTFRRYKTADELPAQIVTGYAYPTGEPIVVECRGFVSMGKLAQVAVRSAALTNWVYDNDLVDYVYEYEKEEDEDGDLIKYEAPEFQESFNIPCDDFTLDAAIHKVCKTVLSYCYRLAKNRLDYTQEESSHVGEFYEDYYSLTDAGHFELFGVAKENRVTVQSESTCPTSATVGYAA